MQTQAIAPARTSSINIPQLPGNFSAVETGGGFVMSNRRKKAKLISRVNGSTGRKDMETKYPAISSLTICFGSSCCSELLS